MRYAGIWKGDFLKIIFLDIDGVLNCQYSRSRCSGVIGIDDKKVKYLHEIIKRTKARIVLTSTWKSGWDRNTELQDEFGKYLTRKLKRQGIFVYDKTNDNGHDRGLGIINWLSGKNIDSWIVVDDEVFEDYEKYDIMSHLVKTSFYDTNGGLTQRHVDMAIEKLNLKD